MAEIMGCIFSNHLKFDPKNPEWEDRDKLILSKGHAFLVYFQTWQ